MNFCPDCWFGSLKVLDSKTAVQEEQLHLKSPRGGAQEVREIVVSAIQIASFFVSDAIQGVGNDTFGIKAAHKAVTLTNNYWGAVLPKCLPVKSLFGISHDFSIGFHDE